MELWELVRLVSERYGQRLQQHEAHHTATQELRQVSVQQFQYLQAIHRMDSPTVSALASHFKVRAPSTTALLQRLEEQGFIKRKADPEDGRIQRISLSPKGKRILSVQDLAFKALALDIEHSLSQSELKSYIKLTEKVCRAFETLPDVDKKGS